MSRLLRAVSVLTMVGLAAGVGIVLRAEQVSPPPPSRRAPVAAPAARVAAQRAAAPISLALIDQYCVTCHNQRLKTGGLVLEGLDPAKVAEHAELLEKVVRKLSTGQMPPPGRPRPDKPAVTAFVNSVESALDNVAAASPNPGRLAVHRLNRLEYVNTIHDLLALDIDPALLPADSGGVGFDNNADVLSVTPALMNRYMSAATKVSRLALGDRTIRPSIQVFRASDWAMQTERTSEDVPFGTHGGLIARHTFPLDGEYDFKVRLLRNFFGGTIRGIDDEHQIEVRVDGALVQRYTVGGKYKGADAGILIAIPEDEVEAQKLHAYHLDADKDFNFRIPVKAGLRVVAATFTNSAPGVDEMVPLRPRSLKSSNFDDASAPAIGTIEIAGPYGATVPEDTASRRKIFICRPANVRDEDPCARRILSSLARRAYRRPVADADLSELMRLYALGRKEGTFEAGIGRALEGLLSMPAFVLRLEEDPADAKPGEAYRVSDLELASRLSFFLWRSMPDDELLDLATKGRLRTPTVLAQQVHRLLADEKAKRWMNDFVGQWLVVRNLQAMEPDPNIFPDFDDNLRDAMIKETQLFFESQVRENHSLPELLRADYTYLNERLARHYGIKNVYGNHFRKVAITDPARQGLLGQAGVLTVTSYAHRTSVVLRGKWVLENLLGTPPPAPPPNVPPLKENDGKSAPTSLRERMQQHRANSVCATCHTRMDPIGFALENFDAIGKWRDTESGARIDAASTLADGTIISSPKSFREVLLQGDQFTSTVIEKLFSYALGRSVAYFDQPTLRRLLREAAADDFRWSSLILDIVNSQPFLMRRVPDRTPAAPGTVAQGQ
jgi:mono/diheme cytochrome c family protein